MGGKTDPNGRMLLMGAVAAVRQKWRKRLRQWRAFLHMAARFTPYVRKRRGRLALALACTLGYTLMGLLEPWPMKLIFDNVLLERPISAFLAPVLTHVAADRFHLLYVLVTAIVLIAVARSILYFYRGLLKASVGQQAVADIRLDLYSHIQHLSFSFHERRRTGDILARLTTDIRVLRNILIALPLSVTGELFLVVGMVTVMFLMDWRLTVIALIVLPGVALSVRMYQRPMKQAIRKQREREGHLATMAAEVLGAYKVVQSFTRERYEIERFSSQNKRSLRSGLRAARLEAKLNWAAELIVATATALVLAVAVRRVLAGALSPGDLLVFVAYLRSFYRPLRRISRTAEQAARGTASGERVLEMLEKRSTVQDRLGAVLAPRFHGEIAYEGVSFWYGKGTPVLSDITLHIEPGECVAIVGATGAGKTTLVSLIPRFYDPTRGRVCIDGRDVRDFTLLSLRQQISLVFQEAVLFATTIAENIGHGKPDATIEEIVKAAELAGIHSIIEALPEGYNTVIGERGGTLSGGQRQCVAIARAIIRNPAIVILDEPTVGLDSQSAALVMEALRRLMKGRTVIIISHQLRSVQNADRLIVLDGGRIVEEGTHSTLLALDGLYHQLQVLQGGELTP